MPSNHNHQSVRHGSEKEEQAFDHGITALFLFFFSGCFVLLGSAMTAVAYTLEARDDFTSVAEYWNLRTDIAGPVLLAIGGAGFIVAIVLVTAFGVCNPPDWSNRKINSTAESPVQDISEDGRY